MPRSIARAAMAAGFALFAVACGVGGASPTAAGATAVNAELREFSLELNKTSVPAGDVDFLITNAGTIDHEFVLVDTDTPASNLTVEGSTVSEDDLDVVDEAEDIAAGATTTLSLDGLAAGHYAIICNVEGHYQSGMHVDLTVQ